MIVVTIYVLHIYNNEYVINHLICLIRKLGQNLITDCMIEIYMIVYAYTFVWWEIQANLT